MEPGGGASRRASALTLVIPLKWWARPYLWVVFAYLQLPFKRPKFEALDELRFIHAIRWSVLPPLARPRWTVPLVGRFLPRGHGRAPQRGRAPEQRWQLLFESNFDGDWDEYLDAFGSVLGRPLNLIVLPCVGYPGLTSIALFKLWAKVNDHQPEHYASAYPSATAIDIREAMAQADPTARTRVVHLGYGSGVPAWSTFVVPLTRDRAGEAIAAARRLDRVPTDDDPATSVLVPRVDGIHFLRLVVLDLAASSTLLFTVVHDHHDPVELVGALLAADPGPLHELLSCASGVPDGMGDDDLAAFVVACEPPSVHHSLRYCAYPGLTAAEIRALVEPIPPAGPWPDQEVDV